MRAAPALAARITAHAARHDAARTPQHVQAPARAAPSLPGPTVSASAALPPAGGTAPGAGTYDALRSRAATSGAARSWRAAMYSAASAAPTSAMSSSVGRAIITERRTRACPVSYTHLTLPTICSV
eukprot:5707962-Prymnesium_polylepis.1